MEEKITENDEAQYFMRSFLANAFFMLNKGYPKEECLDIILQGVLQKCSDETLAVLPLLYHFSQGETLDISKENRQQCTDCNTRMLIYLNETIANPAFQKVSLEQMSAFEKSMSI